MTKRHSIFIALVLGLLVAGLAGYGACTMEIDDTANVLGEVPPMPDAAMPTMPPELDDPPIDPGHLGTGVMPDHPDPGVMPEDPIVPEVPGGETDVNVDLPDETMGNMPNVDGRTFCGATTCGADEFCCHHEGTCYPRTCVACCSGADDQPRPDETVLDPPVINPVAR
ncbi:MAG: hypothetical protein R3B82_02655 [Sandaracinaceae bacterium]